MRGISIVLVVMGILGSPQIIYSQENGFSDAGILPDSPLYVFKRIQERVDLFFTFETEDEIKKHLHYADLRLLELRAMAQKGDMEKLDSLSVDYESHMNAARTLASSDGQNLKAVAAKSSEHLTMMDVIRGIVPDDFKNRISAVKERAAAAMNESISSLSKGVQNVSGKNSSQNAD